MKTRTLKVVGTSFPNDDGSSRSDFICKIVREGLRDECVVTLVDEPDNEYDPNAISVRVTVAGVESFKIGHVPAKMCDKVRKIRDDLGGQFSLNEVGDGEYPHAALLIRWES